MMNWGAVLGVTVVVSAIALYEWQGLRSKPKRDKWAFAAFAAMGWGLALLLIFFPGVPSPSRWVEVVYGPLGKLLEK
jgi:multisubunit Na+/H+ antiporter MnhB subunit